MTERKPRHLSFESWVDGQLREAREQGLFEDLPGAGKPLEDLEEAYDPFWWAKKLARRERLDVVPPAVEIRRKVERLREAMAGIASEQHLREGVRALNEEIRRLNTYATHGPPTTQAPLDVDAELARWRALREDAD